MSISTNVYCWLVAGSFIYILNQLKKTEQLKWCVALGPHPEHIDMIDSHL